MRDLCRVRADMVGDLTQAKNRLLAFLLRHGRVWRDGEMWTLKHRRWLAAQCFDDPALATTFAYYRAAVETREVAIDAPARHPPPTPAGERGRPLLPSVGSAPT